MWRLILDDDLPGERNMALDRAIQQAVEAGESPSTLRLYGWARPTVTLGKFQDRGAVDAEAVTRYGIDVVRRFTGGRGVLHDDEVTYAIIARVSDGIPRGVAASYRVLCAALVLAYRRLGVSADLTSHDAQPHGSGACYLQTTRADLTLDALKLSGSAQVWFGDTVLQHGSFVMSRDIEREAAVFALDRTAADRLALETATLATAGASAARETVREAVAQGVRDSLGVTLVQGEASESELARAAELLSDVQVDVGP